MSSINHVQVGLFERPRIKSTTCISFLSNINHKWPRVTQESNGADTSEQYGESSDVVSECRLEIFPFQWRVDMKLCYEYR